MTDQRKRLLRRKLQESRQRILRRDVDLAIPLLDMVFVATNRVRRISTNGEYIFFDPAWLSKLSNYALDFALAHQLMHIQLGHIRRSMLFQGDRYHLACDIVANARLVPYGFDSENIPGLGHIYTETFFPKVNGCTLTAEDAFDMVPFDPSMLKKGQRDRYILDDESRWGTAFDPDDGSVVLCPEDPDPDDLSIAIEEYSEIIRIHWAKKGKEELRVELDESVYERHEQSVSVPDWETINKENIESLRQFKERAKELSDEAENGIRFWHPLKDSRLPWRELLSNFLQDVTQDYSFTPPDKRYTDSDFFLPDFNDTPALPKDILFYVDTSGSVDDTVLSQVATEICGAIEQFNGRMDGTLIFFDRITYPEIPFHTVRDISATVPEGGGGTDFRCIFRHATHRQDRKPVSSIVIFTDGDGTYPDRWNHSIPILWIINNKTATPPFGTVARM